MQDNQARFGSYTIGGTTAWTGRAYRLLFLADAIFSSLTDQGVDAATLSDVSIGAVTYKQGDQIDGDFTRIKLASGACRAYLNNVAT